MSECLTDFYMEIESGVRRLVFLLRNDGINTECSCHHKGYIQCQTIDPTSEIRIIKSILWDEKIEDYEIEIRHEGMNISSCLVIRAPAFKEQTCAKQE